jgi:PAS domain S-box-containing protein
LPVFPGGKGYVMQKILAIHSLDPRSDSPDPDMVERISHLFPQMLILSAIGVEEGLATANREKPDVILLELDDVMPDTEAGEFYKQLKESESTRHIPVIMFTGGEKEQEFQSPGELLYGSDILLSKAITDPELEVHLKLLIRLKEKEEQLLHQETLFEEAIKTARVLQKVVEERTRIEAELRQNLEKYQKLIDNSNDAIYLVYNRKFEFINKKFQEMFKVTKEEVNQPGFDFMELVAPRSKALIEERNRMLVKGEETEPKYEFVALSRDGREIEVEASVSRIRYKEGMGVLGVIRDITHRKQLEHQVRHAQKIEAIGTLAGGIAHQFNNILAIIRGYAELSYESLTENPVLKRNLQHVLTASDRARELVNQILIFSQQAKEGQKPLDINVIIKDSLQLLQASLPTNIEFRQDIEDNAGFVLAEPNQIRQLIVNLCTNATQAIGKQNGLVEVSLKKVVLGPGNMTGLKNLDPGVYMRLTVSDSGHGMEQKVKDRIFDPFFTTKATGEGLGMGLAVIHGIVKTCGGDIQVESKPGKGTAFHLFFPCIDFEKKEPQIRIRKQLTIKEPIPGGNERLLFVDDEQMLVEVHQEILERLGYNVMAVRSGFEALELFNEDPEIFDLVITDHAMPGMTGIELSRKLLRIRVDIPIILCTGLTKTTICQEAKDAGISELVMKPIIMKDLDALIRDVLKRNTRKGSKQ